MSSTYGDFPFIYFSTPTMYDELFVDLPTFHMLSITYGDVFAYHMVTGCKIGYSKPLLPNP